MSDATIAERGWRVVRGPTAPPSSLLTLLAVGSVLLLASARWLPWDQLPGVLCPLRRATGVPCPACGGTRAFVHATHGRFLEALQMNPLAALLVVIAVLLPLWWLLRVSVVRRPVVVEAGRRLAWWLRALVWAALALNGAYLLVTRSAG